MGVKCPRCGSDLFRCDISGYGAYDYIVNSISATKKKNEGFVVPCECTKCGLVFGVEFYITKVKPLEPSLRRNLSCKATKETH